jgi:hypothetical protein
MTQNGLTSHHPTKVSQPNPVSLPSRTPVSNSLSTRHRTAESHHVPPAPGVVGGTLVHVQVADWKVFVLWVRVGVSGGNEEEGNG